MKFAFLSWLNWLHNDIIMPLVAGASFAMFLYSDHPSWAGVALAIGIMSLNGAIRGAGQDQTSRIERRQR